MFLVRLINFGCLFLTVRLSPEDNDEFNGLVKRNLCCFIGGIIIFRKLLFLQPVFNSLRLFNLWHIRPTVYHSSSDLCKSKLLVMELLLSKETILRDDNSWLTNFLSVVLNQIRRGLSKFCHCAFFAVKNFLLF